MVNFSPVVKRLVRKLSGNGKALSNQFSFPSPHPAFNALVRGRDGGSNSVSSSSGGGSLTKETVQEEKLPSSAPDKSLVTKLLSQFKQTSEVREYMKLFGRCVLVT
jgi:hypothetical protein